MLGLRLLYSYAAPWIPEGAREAAFVLLLTGGMLIGHAWTFHLVDRRGWDFVGLGRAGWRPGPIATSALLGALAIAVPSAGLLAAGWLRVTPSVPGSSLGSAAATLAVLAPAALWEELFVRGYAFSLVRERWGPAVAIVATALLFGLMHFLNEGASISTVSVVILAGLFLGLVRDVTRSLYAAWAAHLAWNAVLVVLMHATVSGLTMAAPDYRVVDAGPDWATGGAWGPEGGLFAAAGLVAASLYVFRRSTRRPEPDA